MSGETAIEVGRLYLPIKAIADVLTASQKDLFTRLPGLQGYWTMGARSYIGNVIEHGGSGLELFENGTCPTGWDGNPHIHLGDGINFVNASVGFGITGLETWIDAALRGLTIGGWFSLDALPAETSGLISKMGVVTDYGYALTVRDTGEIVSVVSGNGSALTIDVSTAIETGEWVFLVTRFTPSTELATFVNGVKTANTTAIPASLYAATQDFEVGRYLDDDDRIPHARARDVFVCAAALSDALIEQIRATSVP